MSYGVELFFAHKNMYKSATISCNWIIGNFLVIVEVDLFIIFMVNSCLCTRLHNIPCHLLLSWTHIWGDLSFPKLHHCHDVRQCCLHLCSTNNLIFDLFKILGRHYDQIDREERQEGNSSAQGEATTALLETDWTKRDKASKYQWCRGIAKLPALSW